MQVVWFGIPAIAKSKYFIALVKIQYKYFIAFVKYNTFTLSDSQIYTLIPLPSGPLSPPLSLSLTHTQTHSLALIGLLSKSRLILSFWRKF
jgi:hypothetical protein